MSMNPDERASIAQRLNAGLLYVSSNGTANATYAASTLQGRINYLGDTDGFDVGGNDPGSAPVREPRRPKPSPLSPAAAVLPVPVQMVYA